MSAEEPQKQAVSAPEKPPEKKPPRALGRILVATGALAVIGVGAAIAGYFTLYAPFRVPSGAMYPAIIAGDHIKVNRFAAAPSRGEVVAFHHPEHPEQLFVSRVIGMPGDEVRVVRGRLFLNGWEVPHCIVGRSQYKDTEGGAHYGDFEVEFLGDRAYLLFRDTNGWLADQQGPYRVKAGEYFMMGDNRENAYDSRLWWNGQGGGVQSTKVVGSARLGASELPPEAKGLLGLFAQCLAARPTQTAPPPPK